MLIAKLLDASGRPIKNPVAISGSVSFDAREGVAQAWMADGRTLYAELVKARVAWMGAAGCRIEGMEPFEGPDGTHFRAMEWQQIYSGEDCTRDLHDRSPSQEVRRDIDRGARLSDGQIPR